MTCQISVLMSTYNDGPFLERAILSILEQSFSDYEFIIIDDNSSDETVSILDRYSKLDRRIKIIRNDVNLGLAGSLNRGLEVAQGDWIARMDGDDVSHPQRFKIQMDYLLKNQLIYLGTGVELIDKETGRFIKHYHEPLTHGEIAWKLLTSSAFIHATTIGRKDIILKCGGYNPAYRKYEDADLWRKLIFKGKCANLPDSLYTYRTVHKPITPYMEDIIVSVHQAYIRDLIGKDVSRDFILYLYNPGTLEYRDLSVKPMEIVEILLKAYQEMDQLNWFQQDDYSRVNARFWELLRPFPSLFPEATKKYGQYYWQKMDIVDRELLYWETKHMPGLLKFFGMFLISPFLLLQKIKTRLDH